MHNVEGAHKKHCCSLPLAELSPPSLAVELHIAQASKGPLASVQAMSPAHVSPTLFDCMEMRVGKSSGIGHSLNSQP